LRDRQSGLSGGHNTWSKGTHRTEIEIILFVECGQETAHWCGLLALFGFSNYVTSHFLAVVPLSGAKEFF
jgi:hypothetical protein